jgi:putative MATE family efflux protein
LKDLTTGKERQKILQFAWPLLLGNIIQQLYHIVDTIIVGKVIGKNALAAVGASFPIIFTLISLVIGLVTGATIIISQYYGAGDMKSIRKSMDTMYVVLVIFSLFISFIGIFFSEDIFLLLNLPHELLGPAKQYLNIFLGGIVWLFLFNGTNAVLRGLGDSKTPLYFLISSTLLNIVLDLLFIIKLGMGVEGAALATVISQAFVFIISIIYLNKYHKIVQLSLSDIQFNWLILKKIIRIGMPSGIQHASVAIGMMVIIGIVNSYGIDVIAAFSAGARINTFASMPMMVFSMALSTFVGQNIGARKEERIKKGLNVSLTMAVLITIGISGTLILFRNFLMGAFTNNETVIAIGAKYLAILSGFYIFFTVMFMINGLLRGAGDTMVSMMITIFSLWIIRIPLALVLSKNHDEAGIWWAFPISWLVGMIISYIYYISGRWKKKNVLN